MFTNDNSVVEITDHKSSETEFLFVDVSSHNKIHSCCGETILVGLSHVESEEVTCLGTVCTDCGGYFSTKNTANHVNELVTYTSTGNDTHSVKHECCGTVVPGVACTYEKGICTDCGAYHEPELSEGAYVITNVGELFWWANNTENANATLGADIDLAGFVWESVQNYSGTFDGAGYEIHNMSFDGYGHRGFIKHLNGATVKNLGFVNPQMERTQDGQGVLAAYSYGATVINCYSITTGAALDEEIGGLIGKLNEDNTEFINCYTTHVSLFSILAEGTYSFENCYYIASSEDSFDGTACLNVSALTSGQLAFLLGESYGQKLDGDGELDAYPVISGAKVYKNQIGGCTEASLVYGYSNTEKAPEISHLDENTDHICDNGCGKTDMNMNQHADGEDYNHLCDYGCGQIVDSGCYDVDKNHVCDECGIADMSAHTDGEDENHLCDYGCGQIADSGCYDVNTDTDHKCDECGAENVTAHTDSIADNDHLCDNGCGAILEACTPNGDDGDCTTNITCSICGAVTSEGAEAHKDLNNDEKCDACGYDMPKPETVNVIFIFKFRMSNI